MHKVFIINDTRPENHHGCTVVMKNIRAALLERGAVITGTSPIGSDWKKKRFRAALDEASLVLVNGEGSIHHNRPYARLLLEAGSFFRAAGKKTVCINTVWQDNHLLNDLVDDFDLFYVRDNLSKEELRKAGKAVPMCPDMTFFDTKPRNETQPGHGLYPVAVTDSVDEHLSKELWRAALDNGWEYLPITRRFKKEPKNYLGQILRSLKMHFYPSLAKIKILQLLIRHTYIRQRYSTRRYAEYLEKICAQSLVITARYHALCFCIQTETPFIALASNTHKVEALIQDAGLAPRRLCARFPESAAPAEWTFSESELAAIRAFNSSAKSKIDSMFDQICSL